MSKEDAMQNEAMEKLLEKVSGRTKKTILEVANAIMNNLRVVAGEARGVYEYKISRNPLDNWRLNTLDIVDDVRNAIAKELETAGFKLRSLYWNETEIYGTVRDMSM